MGINWRPFKEATVSLDYITFKLKPVCLSYCDICPEDNANLCYKCKSGYYLTISRNQCQECRVEYC